MSLYRFRFLLESTNPRPAGAVGYVFCAESGKLPSLDVGPGQEFVRGASGIISFETQESLEDQTGGIAFGYSKLSARLADLVRTNDRLRIEIMAPGADRWLVTHDGFVSRVILQESSSEGGVTWSLNILAEGIRKLFSQSVWNWQGALCMGRKDAVLEDAPMAEYATLQRLATTHPPHVVIQSLVKLFLDPTVGCPLKMGSSFTGGERPLAELIGFGEDWSSRYTKQWPSMATVIASTWQGDFWSWIQTMADPALHEMFWRYGDDGRNLLYHRPRPFPGKKPGGWTSLACHVTGFEEVPTCSGLHLQRDDSQRANAFHWVAGGVDDAGPGGLFAKMGFGWWMDDTSRRRYGFAPRPVQTNLLPIAGQEFADMVKGILEDVAHQDAPIHELLQGSMTFAVPMPGVRPGEALEDRSRKLCGYVSSVSHQAEWSEDGFRAGTTVGLSRALRNCTFEDYPKRVAALVNLRHEAYKTESRTERPAHERATEAARTGKRPEKQKAERTVPASVPASFMRPAQGPVNSPFGQRERPLPNASRDHEGVDIGGKAGDPVRAPVIGTVVFAGWKGGYGNAVEIRTADKAFTHLLGHLQEITVRVGQHVGPGDEVGKMGSTGTSTGVHVHWGVTDRNGNKCDPMGKV